MSVFSQKTFIGGMDMLSNKTQIPANAYEWLINGRQRIGQPQPTKKHVVDATAPAGKKQGIISVGNVLLCFVSGKAYYKLENGTNWIPIANFSMDTIVDRYYTQAVPASKFNLGRQANVNVQAAINVPVNVSVNGTPQGILVQDGVNQPWIIFYDPVGQFFYARVTQNYSQWVQGTGQEYVPIGKQMMILNEILFIVTRDNKAVYRSVTGRPLDFVVAVDTNGNKLPTELLGGAAVTSFAFDFDAITCLRDINIPNAFVYATENVIRIVAFDFTKTIFGEPTFTKSALIEAGVVNQDSFIELLGDYAFVDFENVTTFNAVAQLRFEGKNSIFSLNLARLLGEVKQTRPCCVVFDSYALFDLNTKWGRATCVYDILLDKWISIDVTDAGYIRQFCILNTSSSTKLFCITEDNDLLEMYSGERNSAQLLTRAWTGESNVEQKLESVRTLFNSGTEDGTVRIVELICGKQSQTITRTLEGKTAGIPYPVIPPVFPNNKQLINNEAFSLNQGLAGSEISLIIQWDNAASLSELLLITQDQHSESAIEQSTRAVS